MKSYIIIAVAIATIAAIGGAYATGRSHGVDSCQNKTLKADNKAQKERAHDAERQRDIANAPPASLDAVLDWLR